MQVPIDTEMAIEIQVPIDTEMAIEVELINALPCILYCTAIHPSIHPCIERQSVRFMHRVAVSQTQHPPGVYFYMVCANQSKMWEEWMLDVQAKAMTGLDWTGPVGAVQ